MMKTRRGDTECVKAILDARSGSPFDVTATLGVSVLIVKRPTVPLTSQSLFH